MKSTLEEVLKLYKVELQRQLKPCPFCGEEKNIAIHLPNSEGKEDVTCLKCGATMQKALGIGVVSCWNQRKS